MLPSQQFLMFDLVHKLSLSLASVGNVLILGVDLNNDSIKVQRAIVIHISDTDLSEI